MQTGTQAKPAPPEDVTASGASVTAVAIALVIAAGIAGAVQAAVMGELGERTGVFPALAFAGVVSVALGLTLLLIARQSFRGLGDVVREPVWLWIGGALSVLIILAITVASPRIGLAATIGTIIALNLAMAAAIDRFGWFGLDRIGIAWPRAVGLVLLGAGAALTLVKTG
jgi:transporter family-2 protein